MNTITAYGDDYVAVNGERHHTSLIVTAEQVLPWPVEAFDSLTAEDFAELKTVAARHGLTPKQPIPSPTLVHMRGGRAAIDDVEHSLQPLLDQVYDEGRYADLIDYTQPAPAFSVDEARWITDQVERWLATRAGGEAGR